MFGLTQSISRTRWWATRIMVGGLPVVAGVTLLGLLNAWIVESSYVDAAGAWALHNRLRLA